MTRSIAAILTVLLIGACATPQAAPASPSALAAPFEVVVALAGGPSMLDQQQRLGAVDGIGAAPNYDSLLYRSTRTR